MTKKWKHIAISKKNEAVLIHKYSCIEKLTKYRQNLFAGYLPVPRNTRQYVGCVQSNILNLSRIC